MFLACGAYSFGDTILYLLSPDMVVLFGDVIQNDFNVYAFSQIPLLSVGMGGLP